MDKRKLCVYDTMSGKYTDVEVTDEIYIHYNRTQWNI
ncbi:MAG: sigma-70 family RNA polymerase sigma factor, partial [Ruminococcus sp.]|nr:sigma-70 family RNA polymerase sigma factor [Ruminococcus sp.]